MFALCRLNYQRFPTLGLYLKLSLYSIIVYAGFGLDRFCLCAFSSSLLCYLLICFARMGFSKQNISTMECIVC